MLRNGFVLFSLILCFSACRDKKGNQGTYVLSGKIAHPGASEIYLYTRSGKNLQVMDSSEIKSDGSYRMEGMAPAPVFAYLGWENTATVILVLDNKNLEINFDADNPDIRSIKGSRDNRLLGKLDSLEDDQALKNFIDSTTSIVSLRACFYLDLNRDYDFLKRTLQRFEKEMPGSRYTSLLEERLSGVVPLQIGNTAPEIRMANSNGDTLALSSLRGKVVLVDFWASWCGPCRDENPADVALYKKYKDNGFTIFSVSLDTKRENWLKAIGDDGLAWKYHVSELKGWETPILKKYNVQGIPYTVLLDREGKIIALQSKGEELEETVRRILY